MSWRKISDRELPAGLRAGLGALPVYSHERGAWFVRHQGVGRGPSGGGHGGGGGGHGGGAGVVPRGPHGIVPGHKPGPGPHPGHHGGHGGHGGHHGGGWGWGRPGWYWGGSGWLWGDYLGGGYVDGGTVLQADVQCWVYVDTQVPARVAQMVAPDNYGTVDGTYWYVKRNASNQLIAWYWNCPVSQPGVSGVAEKVADVDSTAAYEGVPGVTGTGASYSGGIRNIKLPTKVTPVVDPYATSQAIKAASFIPGGPWTMISAPDDQYTWLRNFCTQYSSIEVEGIPYGYCASGGYLYLKVGAHFDFWFKSNYRSPHIVGHNLSMIGTGAARNQYGGQPVANPHWISVGKNLPPIVRYEADQYFRTGGGPYPYWEGNTDEDPNNNYAHNNQWWHKWHVDEDLFGFYWSEPMRNPNLPPAGTPGGYGRNVKNVHLM